MEISNIEINEENNINSNIEEKKEKTHVMVYIGIAIAVVVVIAAGLIIYFFKRPKKQKKNSHIETAEEPPTPPYTNIERSPETYVNSPINIYNVRNGREINNVSENQPQSYSKDISKNIIISK